MNDTSIYQNISIQKKCIIYVQVQVWLQLYLQVCVFLFSLSERRRLVFLTFFHRFYRPQKKKKYNGIIIYMLSRSIYHGNSRILLMVRNDDNRMASDIFKGNSCQNERSLILKSSRLINAVSRETSSFRVVQVIRRDCWTMIQWLVEVRCQFDRDGFLEHVRVFHRLLTKVKGMIHI